VKYFYINLMKIISCLLFIIFIYGSSIGQHKNIIIDESTSNLPNEPTIKMDPLNTNHILAASNINNYYVSFDGGESWTIEKLSSDYGVWGDPSLAVDSRSNFYFFHLSNPPVGNWIDRIVCQSTADLGKVWTPGSFMGLNDDKAQDKEWPAIDRHTNNIYVTWTQFDEYGSTASSDSSHIMFSRSLDQGMSWSPAIRIDQTGGNCIDGDDTVEGAVPAIGPSGEIYVSWAGPEGIVFDRSLDQGESWLQEDIFVTDMPGGWNYDVPGIMRCNGLPVTACDTSGGIFNGNIYINWTDQRNGINDTDVWLVRSSDRGNSWSDPIRVNDDAPGKHQFFSWMDIDQTNGNIYIVFYDRRQYSGKYTDVVLARSTDGGQRFQNYIISESPFSPNSGIFFGDYTNISVHNDVIRPIWTRLHKGELSILTALVDKQLLTTVGEQIPYAHHFELEQNYPNPFRGDTYISFKLRREDTLDLLIYDSTGNELLTLFKGKPFAMGKHILQLNDQFAALNKGIYYYLLRSSTGTFSQKKMIYLAE